MSSVLSDVLLLTPPSSPEAKPIVSRPESPIAATPASAGAFTFSFTGTGSGSAPLPWWIAPSPSTLSQQGKVPSQEGSPAAATPRSPLLGEVDLPVAPCEHGLATDDLKVTPPEPESSDPQRDKPSDLGSAEDKATQTAKKPFGSVADAIRQVFWTEKDLCDELHVKRATNHGGGRNLCLAISYMQGKGVGCRVPPFQIIEDAVRLREELTEELHRELPPVMALIGWSANMDRARVCSALDVCVASCVHVV